MLANSVLTSVFSVNGDFTFILFQISGLTFLVPFKYCTLLTSLEHLGPL